MRILFVIHLYYPHHGAGAESMVKNICEFLLKKGHECRILLKESSHYGVEHIYNYEGVEVHPMARSVEGNYHWADILVTHLVYAAETGIIAGVLKKPVYFLSHNTAIYDFVDGIQHPVRVVYTSEAMRNKLNYQSESFILHPPVDFRKMDLGFDPSQNEYITLINLNANKGGALFWEIARAMPEKKFLGVTGAYDPQVHKDLPNVKIVPNTPNILDIYGITRIIIMPSEYESWGMVATEAMCNGIPVIYNPTFGLEENVGDAGIRCKRIDDPLNNYEGGDGEGILPIPENVEKWVKAIKSLDNHVFYMRVSNRSRKRSRELDPLAELEAFEKWITS